MAPARISLLLAFLVLPFAGQVAAAEPRLDGLGDPLPPGAVGRLGTVRFRAGPEVKALLFAPDGRTLVSGSTDGSIRFWDPKTGKVLRRFTGHQHGITCLALSSDGKTLASASHDQTARLWDVASGRQLGKVTTNKGWITAVAFSSDGKTLACANTGNTVGLYDAASGEPVRTLEGRGIWGTAVVFSKDGKTVVSSTKDYMIRCWDAASGEERTQFEEKSIVAYALALSPDGTTLAAAGSNYVVHLWNMETGKDRGKLEGHEASVYAVSYAADGRTLVSADCTGKVRVWDAATGKTHRTIPAEEEGGVPVVALSPDGKTIASAGKSQAIHLSDVATGQEAGVRRDAHGNVVFGLAFRPDGRELISNSRDGTLRVWNTATGQQRLILRGHRHPPFTMAISPDGKTLGTVSEDRTIRAWSLSDGSAREFQALNTTEVIDLLFTADSELLAWVEGPANRNVRNRLNILDGGNHHDMDLCYVASGKSRQRFHIDASAFQNQIGARDRFEVFRDWPGHLDRINTAALSRSGTLVATGGNDKNIILWDAARGKLLQKMIGHQGAITSLAFSADDRWLVSTATDNTIRLWEVATRRPIAVIPPLQADARAAALAPDGRTLAWAGTSDNRIRLRDLVHDRELPSLDGHEEPITVLAFSPDGRRLASGSVDTTVLLWDVNSMLDKARLGADALIDLRDAGLIWGNLASDDAAAGYSAVWALVGSKPEQSLAFLKERLKLDTGKQRPVAPLIDDLDSGTFQVRRRATETLENLGEIVRPDLLKALQAQPSFEMRQRLEQVLAVLDNRRGRLSQEELRQVRAVLVLEWLGTPDARQFLEQVAKGPPTWWQTREAQAALRRLDKPAAAK